MCSAFSLSAQQIPAQLPSGGAMDSTKMIMDTLPNGIIDTLVIGNVIGLDSMTIDSLNRKIQTQGEKRKLPEADLGVEMSEDGLDEIFDYGAADSSFIDRKENQIHLFGEAFIKYKDYDLKAGYIIFDFDDNEASAFRIEDAFGKKTQRPDFTDGTNKFKSNGLRFNFKSNKGLIFDAVTTEGEFTIHGGRTKFISKDADSLSVGDLINNENARFTTCDADHPHFYFRTRKLKIVANKLAIMGVTQLEIMGIPTPIILPFGFFPLVEGRSSGLIFPNNIEFDPNLGIGFREVGYYFPINDYIDLRVTGDIYTRGTHRVNLASNYKKRYKYTGNAQLSYANNIGESLIDGSRTSNRSYKLRVTHNQDAKAHPYQSIGGTINLSTNRYDQVNTNSFENVVNNKISSNFFYKHSLPGTPFSFSAAFTHFQDNSSRKVDITLPDAKLRMNTIYPFKSKKGGQEKWYEQINLSYSAAFKNYVTATDTTLFESETWKNNLQTGLSHNASTGANFNVLKYINVNATARVEQFVLTRLNDRVLNPDPQLDTVGMSFGQDGDTIFQVNTIYDEINEEFIRGINTFEKFNLNVSAQTKRFATVRFAKGWLRGLRHTATPSIGFSFTPDTELKYRDSVMISSNPEDIDEVTYFNPYRGGAFTPSFGTRQMSLTYGLNNLFEGKYYSKADSTEKKFKIFNRINMNGSYNFAADSLKFSPLSVSGNASFFKGLTNVNLRARYNFYEKNEDGRLIDKLVFDETKFIPVEFDNFNLTLTNGTTLGKLRELIFGEKDKDEKEETSKDRNGPKEKEVAKKGITLADWVDNFRISHQMDFQVMRQNNGVDTAFIRSHSIRLSGRIALTDSWNLSVNNISYDLVNKKFVFPQFSLSRDLHCWTMQFSWTPQREVYSFFIGVKSNTLSFLKYNYGQRNSSQLFGR